MFVIKGFMPHSRFANNTQGVVAAFGEISTQALTYARDKGIYKSTLSAEMELYTFTVAQNATVTTLTSNQVDHIATILKWIYDRTLAVHGEVFVDELLPDAMLTFVSSASNFEIGDIVQDSNGYWAPSWISWTAVNVPGIDADNNIKIWLADDAFREQYDDYEVIVVPPTTNLEDFFKTGTEVAKMLTIRTPSDVMYAIQQAKGDNPETIIRAESYDYHDPYDTNHLVPATFHLLIYGAAGNNIDAINDAIVDYLLSNSSRTRDEWIKILPDLFKRTEVITIPLWSQYAIPNRELQAGINSPTTNLKKVVALVKQLVPSYPSAHIDEHLEVTAHPYKSLALAAIGSVDNRNGWFELTDIFPDYIAVSTTSNDFDRMSLNTQNWARLLNSMIIVAEKMGKYTSIPITMSKVTRDGILYLVSRYDNINYLVAAKSNFPDA
jgi:hypothetical protein